MHSNETAKFLSKIGNLNGTIFKTVRDFLYFVESTGVVNPIEFFSMTRRSMWVHRNAGIAAAAGARPPLYADGC